ncbi:ATP-binding cassette domain-containing protein [Virgibacillus soli]|uniref:ABC transporter ATP-binding protein n=1 Tax=Paracerasibacillus soli TaxID=480284 RepID=A0ABU5CMD9_9BACI|nr:ABC transporter ATP-binding protein [Virgibacillus soli]MDY0407539.1 ABC transporter ATP-binding protein [Virgibacillus soli]
MTKLLNVTGLLKRYEKHDVVKNLDFTLSEGKCIALLGPNGAGKTTTLKMLAGLLKPTAGTIMFAGKNKKSDIREYIGYLPQYPAFYGWMTGKEFLVFSARLTNIPKSEANNRADAILDKVGLTDAKNKRIGKYSGGMKQRLGIAQAIIHKPKLLMLDEPVSSLDPIGRREVLTLMEELKEEMTILFSTHILSDAEEMCDELILLHHGEIVEAGTFQELRKKYQTTKIELQLASSDIDYAEKLQQLPTVVKVQFTKGKWNIMVSHTLQARDEIMQLVAREGWPLTDFSISSTSLEELFMKVVNK